MHGAWVRFVETGVPQLPALPQWPAYDHGRRATMRLDEACTVLDDPMADERRLWDGVVY
jgi:para-nitrobenzyl esterase